jgi:hypothetical protein
MHISFEAYNLNERKEKKTGGLDNGMRFKFDLEILRF